MKTFKIESTEKNINWVNQNLDARDFNIKENKIVIFYFNEMQKTDILKEIGEITAAIDLLEIHDFSIRKTGHGQWNVALVIDENENKEQISISTTTTNSRAVDGHDGYYQALAKECLKDNELDYYSYDFSNLPSQEEE